MRGNTDHFEYLSLESSCSGEYNPLTGETDPPHYPELPAGHEMQRDFTSPLSHGSPGEHHHNERYDGEFFLLPSKYPRNVSCNISHSLCLTSGYKTRA